MIRFRRVAKIFMAILTAILLLCGTSGEAALTSEEIAKIALDSTVLLTTESGLGSGFFVADGLVATNHHVIEGSTRIHARLVDSTQGHADGAIWAIDEEHDLAIVKVAGIDAPPLRLGDSDAVEIGQSVYVSGNPRGLVGTFSSGEISAIRPEGNSLVQDRIIQITTPVSPGSSGGPVLNSDGEVIGIIFSGVEEGQNLNFAIPVNFLKRLLRETAPYLRIDKEYNLFSGSVSIAFSPDGRYIATGDSDGDVGLWEAEGGDIIYFQPLGDEVKSIAFSPDGTYLAADGYDGEPYVARLDVSSGTEVSWTRVASASQVYDIAYSPNGRYVAIGADRRWTYLWDVEAGTMKEWGFPDVSEVYAVAYSPNGRYLATGDDAGKAVLWELSSWWTDDPYNVEYVPLDIGGHVHAVTFSPNGRYLAAGGHDGSDANVSIYDVTSGRIVWRENSDYVYAIAFSPDGEYLAIGENIFDSVGRIIFYQFGANITQVREIQTSGKVTDLAWSPDGTLISDGKEVWRITRVHGALPLRLSAAAIDPVDVGDRFTLEFRVEDVTDLAGWQLGVTFNHSVLEAVSVNEGDFLKQDGGGSYFSGGNINNAAGEISDITATRIGAAGISGGGRLLSLTFKAKASGMGWLKLDNVQFVNSFGKVMRDEITAINPVMVGDGYLPSDVNQDGEVDLVDLILISQNFGPNGGRFDVNGDGTVNIIDLMIAAQHLGESTYPAAPIASLPASVRLSNFNQDTIQEWIDLAHAADDGSLTFRQGITYLKRLLAAILPDKTALLPNYPNPFNPETWIPYQLAVAGNVSLTIYDARGGLVRQLDLGHQPAGFYTNRAKAAHWDGRNEFGEPVASGVYFYQLQAGDYSFTRQLVILK